MSFKSAISIVVAIALLTVSPVLAQNVPSGFVVETVESFSGSNLAPYDWAELPNGDGRFIVGLRAGALRLLLNGNAYTIGTIPSVSTGSERGFLSLCVDPQWPSDPYIYTWISRNSQSTMRLSRWTLTGDVNNPSGTNINLGSETILLNNIADSAFNHNGGTVRFGPDGMLYLSMGDDATCSAAQNDTDARGKLMRMNVSGVAAGAAGPISETALDPGDNPMSSSTGAAQLFVAKGLRNPVSFNIDPVTGDIYIADVGQNAREELDRWNRNSGGAITYQNFGWPYREGISNYSGCGFNSAAGLIDPIHDYSQSSGGVSIMSAGFVRSQGQQYDWGSAYNGNAFHTDYFNGTIQRLVGSGQNWSVAPSVPGQPSSTYWGTGFSAAWHFDQASDGAIYFVQHGGTYGTNSGTFKRMRPDTFTHQIAAVSGNNQFAAIGEAFPNPCVVEVTNVNNTPAAGVTVNFSVTNGTLSSLSAVTDFQGRASVNVNAGTLTGGTTVAATTPLGSLAGTSFSLYTRGLRIIYNSASGILVVLLTDSPTGASQVPYIIMVGDPQPPFVTPYGTLALNPLNPANTIVFCDGVGLFNFVTVQNRPCTGNPNLTNVYTGVNVLAGANLTFQAIAYNPGTNTPGWWITNSVNVSF